MYRRVGRWDWTLSSPLGYRTSVQDLVGKVAVVTGGGGGIGRALGERFLAEGMKVVLSDIDEPLLMEHAVAELADRFGDAVARRADRRVAARVGGAPARRDASTAFGAAHLVCNNAGIPSGSDGALWEHHVNDWRWALDVNVLGVVHGINVFVPLLLAQGEGHVVNTSSSNGTFAPLSNSTVYATTKVGGDDDHRVPVGPARGRSTRRCRRRCCCRRRGRRARSTPGSGGRAATGPSATQRPGQAPSEGRDALTPVRRAARAARAGAGVRADRGGGGRSPSRASSPTASGSTCRATGPGRRWTCAPRRCATRSHPTTWSRRPPGTFRRPDPMSDRRHR